MAKYVDKYPHPGPRPPDEDEPGTFSGDSAYKAWRDRAERLHAWSTRMRQHTVAVALDEVVGTLPAMEKGLWVEARAVLVLWLSYLQEPLPKEIFP